MARPRDWRDRAAAELAAKAVRRMDPVRASALVVEDRMTVPDAALESYGATVHRWNRRGFAGRSASPSPPAGPFDLALLRLPRSKSELEMSAHQIAAEMVRGGRMLVYGAKDEGIGSAPGRIDSIFESPESIEIGGHCRVWSLRLRDDAEPRASLDDWAHALAPGTRAPDRLDFLSGRLLPR